MNREKYKKAAKMLLKIIAVSFLIMGLATWLYTSKGLDKLEDPEIPGQPYYLKM